MTASARRRHRLAGRLRASARRLPLARTGRRLALGAVDALEATLGRRPALRPPRRLQPVGEGDFDAVGRAILAQLIELGGVREDARVLDVGCGSGRVAVPLTGFLTGGSYEGLDVDALAVAWCRDAIGARFANFHFTAVDVANTHYNPGGALDPAAVRFPYGDAHFDFAFAASLFTHLLPAGFLNYAAELARVLAPGGTFFGTFFLVDEESVAALRRGSADVELPYRLRDPAAGVEYQAMDRRSPETAVGLDKRFVLDSLRTAGFPVHAVHRGSWTGSAGTSYQDVIVARRPAS